MRRRVCSLYASFVVVLASFVVSAGADTIHTIVLDRPAHFTAPDGSDMQLPPANYHIEQAGESSLRLVKDGAPPIEIQATRIPHDESISAPLALAVVEEGQDKPLHLVLVLPRGQVLDATGSFSGVQSRAISFSTFKRVQIQSM
jgi:hypothetical protein